MTGHLIILGCGKAKLDRPAMAADLYTGALFRDALGYAEHQLAVGACDAIRILSAKHGLLRTDQVISPYELWLGDLSTECPPSPDGGTVLSPYDELAELLDAQLLDCGMPSGHRPSKVTVLGGQPYVDLVAFASGRFELLNPLKGLTQGARRQWFKRQREALP